ncbi:MAG TPA: hypothetical protein VLK23_03705, partial [Thermodesulfobacteriota bacterium]|nr:hypothetical protein [Thermodesulfobacteriota bacterium]
MSHETRNFSVFGQGQGSLPSETLKCGLFEGKQPSDAAEMGRFKDIYPMAHRLNVPLQVFSGET